MDWAQLGVVLLAGVGAGIVGYGAGLASLVSFPALLAVGLPPLAANVTNTMAMVGTTIGGLVTARPDLVGQRARMIKFASAAVVGGVIGAILLLTQPAETFERIVPWLIAFASIVLILRPWLRSLHAGRITEHHLGVAIAIALIAIYGGYFGAAAGVLIVAALGAVMPDSYARVNALRSIVLGSANLSATVIFIFAGPINWPMAFALAIGAFLGSAIAPPIVRKLPETPLRITVGVAGLILAVKLFLDA